jgi:hypothetical protein
MAIKKGRLIKKIILLIILFIFIALFVLVYNKYNFNYFVKSVRESNITTFERDNEIKYSNTNSYKITNEDYNDAMFFQEVAVTPNTPYKVTCMVKTENIENLDNMISGGAHICIEDTTERSYSITGTNDWTKIEMMFNSKNREKVNIGFRLGGFQEKSKGTAWFSNFKVEAGTPDISTKWNFVCFILENTNTIVKQGTSNKTVKESMDTDDVENIENNLDRFIESINSMSDGRMTSSYDSIRITEPITSLSYDEENGYYLSEEDAYNLIDKYLQGKDYDHIFVVMKLGDINKDLTGDIHDWIGLGGMDYFGIGYSNVKIPEKTNYSFTYDSSVNTFPEEVFIHEFLHTLERNAEENGYTVPALHDYSLYGYEDKKVVGLKQWYTDYMQQKVTAVDGSKIGIPKEIYAVKPATSTDFEFSYEIDALKEPENIIEEINSIIKRIEKLFTSNREDIELGWNLK